MDLVPGVDPDRVRTLTAREEQVFLESRATSRRMLDEARRFVSRGVPSSFQDTAPQPVFIERGEGSRVWDVDGNEYVDFFNGFGVMVVGHVHPAVRAAVEAQMARGSHFAQPTGDVVAVAAELARRFQQPQWRFTNSGTESTLDAVHLARGVTGRDRIVKIEGSYHGHHDALMVSVKPPPDRMGPPDRPTPVRYSGGIPDAVVDLVTVVPFNDVDALRRAFEENPGQIAAVIVEPAMMNVGIALPDRGYLDAALDLAHRHGALLVFDEVKTGITIAPGGATERFGVVPDIVCLAKAIGGGLPCGAVGGRADVMAAITDGRVAQMGTFNGNPLTMAASRATLLEVMTPAAYAHLDSLAEELQGGLGEVIARHRLPFHVVAMAARGCVTYRAEPVRNYRDYVAIDKSLPYLSWLYQSNRGVLMAPGAEENWTLSVQHHAGDVRRYVDNFAEFARDLTA